MKKRVLSLFMVLVLCLTLLPTAAFAEGEDVSISGGVIGGGETGGEGGGIYVAPGSPTEGGGGTYIPGEATRTEIWFVRKPDSIGRSYDGTTDGSMVSFGTPQFTDGTNTFELTEGTDFTAKKTFDSADAGDHTVTVEITLIGNAATEYKLKSGEEKFKIRGTINKAYPELTVSLSETTCTVGEKLLPLLSISGRQENAAVTYYYTQYQTLAGASEYEGSDVIPAIDENTAINSLDEEGNNTYYLYAKTAATKNYNEGLSNVVELTVNEAVVEAASVTRADGTDGGTYESLPAALNAAQDGDTVTLGNTVFTVLATPGHTPGGVCYITEHCIFSGDTLFFCSCGRTDFPGGSSREIMDSLQKLAALPGDYTVYPGHDRFSTLNFERQHNPYMKKL